METEMAKKLSIPELEARASKYLGDANLEAEKGNKAKAEKLYDKAQFWLDRANQAIDDRWASETFRAPPPPHTEDER
jgi:hypothetical protein